MDTRHLETEEPLPPRIPYLVPIALAAWAVTLGCPDPGGGDPGDGDHGPPTADDDAADDDTADDCDELLWYLDADGDGYGDDASSVTACEPPAGFVAEGGDCDDGDPAIHPGAEDVPCDGIDTDCSVAQGVVLDTSEYDSIQGAIDEAHSGATIEICPGTHLEALAIDKQIELHLTSSSGDPDDTILDGNGVFRILRAGVQMELLTVSHLTFRDGSIVDPQADGNGGAIYFPGLRLRATDCRFLDNRAAVNGGAVAVEGLGTADPTGGPTVGAFEGCHFEGNGAINDGGAVDALGYGAVQLDITDCTFVDNVAGSSGGAVDVGGWGDDGLEVDGSSFSGNTAGSDGGAISTGSWSSMTAEIAHSIFEGNEAVDDGGAVDHGSHDVGSYHYVDCDFLDNHGVHEGGAMNFGGAEPDQIWIEDCRFRGNVAYAGGGGAIRLTTSTWTDGHSATLTDVVLDGNRADWGSAIATGQFPMIVITLDGGAVTGHGGTAVVLHSGATLQSTGVDWGTGVGDNVPWDVDTYAGQYDYGAGESFACTGNGSCL